MQAIHETGKFAEYRKAQMAGRSPMPPALAKGGHHAHAVAHETTVATKGTPETDHQRVFRFVKEKRYSDAARLAARLVNGGEEKGFFVHSGSREYRAADHWFKSQVDMSIERAPRSLTITVTPQIAQILLEHNPENRRIKAPSLEGMMRDLTAGKWDLNGETIKVSSEGFLNDSQHRQLNCLLTGLPYESVIVFGLTRDSKRTVDIGGKRTAADRAGMRGEKDYIVASGVASLAHEIYLGRKGNDREVDEYLAKYASKIRTAIRAKGTSITGIGPSSAGVAALHLLKLGAAERDIHDFLATVRANEGTRSGNPARTIYVAMHPDSKNQQRLKLSRSEWVSLLCNHFVLWKRGKKTASPLLDMLLPEVL